MGARAFIPAALAAAILFSLAPSTPAAATTTTTTTTEAQQIIRIARSKIGDPWRYGASGPYVFDCSGLVRYAYRRAGDATTIHATSLRSARSLYLYFKAPGGDGTAFATRLLEEEGIAVVPGAAFGSPEWVRASYAAARADVEAAMHGIVRAWRA
jgi:hypothetical protein